MAQISNIALKYGSTPGVGDIIGIGPKLRYSRAWYEYQHRLWAISSLSIGIGIKFHIYIVPFSIILDFFKIHAIKIV